MYAKGPENHFAGSRPIETHSKNTFYNMTSIIDLTLLLVLIWTF